MVRRYGRRFLLGIVALGLAGLAPTGWIYATKGPSYSVAEAPSRDVAIVFGASVLAPGAPSPYLEGRLHTALELYQAGKVKVILVSGDNATRYYDEPTTMRNWLIERGVPDADVVGDFAGFDTYDTCVRAKQIFGVTSATLVTQSYHVPRALATCAAVGVEAIGVGDTSVRSSQRASVWYWGMARELAAAWKMGVDLVSKRTPTLGNPEPGVREALACPR
ncbi:MAG: SanA/YdcF family protein [Propionibacteriaceae bacterium]